MNQVPNSSSSESTSNEPTSSSTTQTIKVLLVEDSGVIRMGIRAILERYDAIEVVAESESGEDSIVAFGLHHPDVVLMDIGLPGISGLEATKAILKEAPEAKIVVLTAEQDEAAVYEAIQAGAHSFCTKNVEPETLFHVIKSSVDGGAWFDPSIAASILSKLKQDAPSPVKSEEVDYYVNKLTERERGALKLLTEGYNNNEIAEAMFISVHTAKVYVTNIISKLEVESRTQAALKALKLGLIE